MPEENKSTAARRQSMQELGSAITAGARAAELAIVARSEAPLDLNEFYYDRRGLDNYLDRDLKLSPTVREYLAARKPIYPFSAEEVEGLEISMELYHGIESPYFIHMSLALQQLGRSWQFEEAAGQFLTGFTLGKE